MMLLEMLLAIGLFGMMLAVLYPGLRLVIAGWQRSGAESAALEEQLSIESFIRDALEGVRPTAEDSTTGSSIAFSGGPESVEFVTLMPRMRAVPGLYRARIESGSTGRRSELRFRYALLRPNTSATGPDAASKTVAVALRDIRFTFWDPKAREWLSSWNGRRGLPKLVRLAALRPETRALTWIIPIRAESPNAPSAP